MNALRISISILLFLIPPGLFAQEGRRMTPAPMFEELEKKWIDAAKNKDTAALNAMFAEEFTVTSSSIMTREEYLKHPDSASYQVQDLTARVYCSTGLVKFRL